MDPCKVAAAKHLADTVVSFHIDHNNNEPHGSDPLVDDVFLGVVEFKDVVHGDQQETVGVLALVVLEVDASETGVNDVELLHNLLLLAVEHHDHVLFLVELEELGLRWRLIILPTSKRSQPYIVTYSLFSSSSSRLGCYSKSKCETNYLRGEDQFSPCSAGRPAWAARSQQVTYSRVG